MESDDEFLDDDTEQEQTAYVPSRDLGATGDGDACRKLGVRPTLATPLFDDSFALPSVVRPHGNSKRLAAWKSDPSWPSRGVAAPLRWDSAAGRGVARSYPYRPNHGSELRGAAAREAGRPIEDEVTLRDLATGRVRVPRGTILQRAEACARAAAQRHGAPRDLVHQTTNRHISLEAQQRHLTPSERQHRINLSLELGISAGIVHSDSDVESTGSAR
jgi:hypothetical protein